MNLPFFGQKQPGDTYYFVPLNVNIFGFVNVAHCIDTNQIVKDHLYANVYKEGTAKRGGNEVASLVMKSLRHIGFMDKERNGVGGELVLCFDNCPGQNKNGMVIRLAMLLVEMSYFKKVIICFLVRGHTKNSCDRLFNLMKRNYRKRNVFSYNDLMELMKTRQCTVLPSEEKDFQDYDDYLGSFYCKLKRVEKDHIFECWKDENGKVQFLSKEGALIKADTMNYETVCKKGFWGRNRYREGIDGLNRAIKERPNIIGRYKVKTLEPPGIPAIKQVGMHQNYGPLVPDQYKNDELYRNPPKKVWEQYLGDKAARDKQKKERKIMAKASRRIKKSTK